MTWALVPDADARHLANRANVTNSKNRVPEFYVVPQCKRNSTDSTVHAGILFLVDANTPGFSKIRFGHGDENFARRRSSTRSILTLPSSFCGSDKPFESVRGAIVLP
jgi:hypothetical protein